MKVRVKLRGWFAGREETRSCGSGATGNAKRQWPPYRKKEQEMTDKFRVIGASLTLLAGLLLVSGGAWANPNKEAIWGEVVGITIIDGGERWRDEEGILHVRNRRHNLTLRGHIDGKVFVVASFNRDELTGDEDWHGSFAFAGEVLGDLVTGRGRFAGACSRVEGDDICEFEIINHLDDGRLAKTTEVIVNGVIPHGYEGVVVDPPGRR